MEEVYDRRKGEERYWDTVNWVRIMEIALCKVFEAGDPYERLSLARKCYDYMLPRLREKLDAYIEKYEKEIPRAEECVDEVELAFMKRKEIQELLEEIERENVEREADIILRAIFDVLEEHELLPTPLKSIRLGIPRR